MNGNEDEKSKENLNHLSISEEKEKSSPRKEVSGEFVIGEGGKVVGRSDHIVGMIEKWA